MGETQMIRQAVADDEVAVRACAEKAYAQYVSVIGRKPAPMLADFGAQIAAGLCTFQSENKTNCEASSSSFLWVSRCFSKM